MMDVYVLDACALIAVLSQEEGWEKVIAVYDMAVSGQVRLVMNKVNLLEVYYGDYRAHGKDAADNMISAVLAAPIQIIPEIEDKVFREAGRLKATYHISLADAIVLAQAAVLNGKLLTSDHHEFDTVEKNEAVSFLWIR